MDWLEDEDEDEEDEDEEDEDEEDEDIVLRFMIALLWFEFNITWGLLF